jgi:DNA-binding NarL/FixJ family response regulator
MKSHGLDELLVALRIIAAGGRYLSSDLASELIGEGLQSKSGPAKPSALAGLTDRELQVLRLIGMGNTTAFIAKSLNISTKTVGAHRENLKNKLNLANAASLARQAVQLVETHVL